MSAVALLLALAMSTTATFTGASGRLPAARHRAVSLQASAGGVQGYFALSDVQLIARQQEDVAAFHAKERNRWEVVYEEECPDSLLESLEFYPGDRVKIVSDVEVKSIENARGMKGTVTHFEFDDGYEACQTCSTTVPVAVLLDS